MTIDDQEKPVIKPLELRDIVKLIDTNSDQPTFPAVNIQQQIQIVVSGGNASLYVYDALNDKWRAATLGT